MAIQISKSFTDISLSFAVHPVTNDILVLKNENAIKKAVMNLVKTRLGERFFNDLLGSSIENSLFELDTSEVSIILTDEITTLLSNFEPRIRVKDVITDIPPDSNELNIQITYDIVGLPFPQQNIEFVLQPTRV